MPLHAKQITQQRFLIAPNITLALEVLRMPTLELKAFLQHQLEENPVLELEVEEDPEEEKELSQEESNGSTDEPPTNGLNEDWMDHWRTAGEREDPNGDDGAAERLIDQRLIHSQSLQDSLRVQLGCLTLSEEDKKLGEAVIQHIDEHGYLEGTLDQLAEEVGGK